MVTATDGLAAMFRTLRLLSTAWTQSVVPTDEYTTPALWAWPAGDVVANVQKLFLAIVRMIRAEWVGSVVVVVVFMGPP